MAQRFFRLVILAILSVALPQAISADEMGYFIRSYHVDATVHEDNVYDVTETIDLTFTEPRHGFYRSIPYEFWTTYSQTVDGKNEKKTLRYVASIDDLSVDGWDYVEFDEGNSVVCRIGNEDETVTGNQRYVIHYKYVFPDDRYDDGDQLSYTILPTECNVPILHFSFRMKFEKDLPVDVADNLIVYYGAYGTKSHDKGKVIVDVKKNLITGSADDIEPHNTVTLYCPLEEGYYEGAKSVSAVPCIMLLGITLLLLGVMLYHEISIHHPHITKTIEFYPPEDVCSAEVGTIIDESADDVDIASLIPWFAHKGYISITEKPDKKGRYGKHASLELTKLKELEKNAPNYQKKLMKLLFGKSSTVVMDEIAEKPKEYAEVKTALQNTFKGERKLTITNKKVWLFLPLFITSTFMFWLSSPVCYSDEDMVLFALLGWAAPMGAGLAIRFIEHQFSFLSKKVSHWALLAFKVAVMLLICGIYYYIIAETGELLPRELGVLVFFLSFIVCEMASRYTVNTEYRARLIGKLMGFKEFIETAEKEQLESLQESDPSYFYKILPYAMVFNISKKWADLFKDIKVEEPDWYRHNDTEALTNTMFINNMTHNLCNSTTHSIQVISHDSSASASSGGGGFAGGGGGGGGCGSW